MSAAINLTAALLEALDSHEPLADQINGTFTRPPVRGTPPYLLIGPMEGRDWSTKTEVGREIVVTLSLFAEEEQAAQLAELMAEAEAAIDVMPRNVGGWQIVSCILQRSRTDRDADPWAGMLTYRARMLST